MRPLARRAASGWWRAGALVAVGALACTAAAASRRPAERATRAPGPSDASSRLVRIALATRTPQVRLTSDGPWTLWAADGRTPLALPQPGESWLLERESGAGVSARREDSKPVSRRDSPIIARPADSAGTIGFNGKRWRGELAISVVDGGLLVVNRVRMDDYVKGVVPLEIGTGAPGDVAAVEAQAVTARSYAVMHLVGPSRPYDMLATVADQVYGGAGAETAVGNRAVDETAGLVLLYNGRAVNAPYHAACGGSTAEPQDVWKTGAEPYLRRVSDQVPGTTRFYCDQAPRYRWTRTYDGEELRDAMSRYLRGLPGGSAGVGRVRAVTVATVTPAGRVGTLSVETDRRNVTLRGNEMRDALRTPSGELLYSTYFSVDAEQGADGVQRLTLHGGGYGHGVGMCQSGAIGRARAGQDFRTILQTYYPGTTVGPL
jgi:stage II sporulation protein D